MRVVFLTGSHPRHAFVARALHEAGVLAGLVIEQREAFVPVAPEGLPARTAALFDLHFRRRDEAEARHFGEAVLPPVTRRDVTLDTLNSPDSVAFINARSPDLVLSYGVHKLTAEVLSAIHCPRQWNIHGGLSPWYRGVTTHFWPSYCLEPQMTGMTVHQLTAAIDGGDIVHQSAADLIAGDGLHDLACRAVASLTRDIAALMEVVDRRMDQPPRPQVTTGRIWRSHDWRPEHLHLIYDHYEDKIVDQYLGGAFRTGVPQLVRQF